MQISQEEFRAYEKVRQSGVTNMLDVSMVTALSGLTRDKVFEIIRRYSELSQKYKKGGERIEN